MPVRVRIDVNGLAQRTYWIGRIEGVARPDAVNKYVIVQGTETLEGWNMPGETGDFTKYTQFEHRYGDGLEVCIEKGLQALNTKEQDA